MAKEQPTLSYYIVLKPYPKDGATVKAVMSDGSVEIWRRGDKGFDSRYKKAMASLNKKVARWP